MDFEDDSEQLIIHDESPEPDRSPRLKRLKKGIQALSDSSMGSLFRDDEGFNIPINSPKSPDSTDSDEGPVESDTKTASLERDKASVEFENSKIDLVDDSELLVIHGESPDPDGSPRLKRLKKGIQAPRASSMGSLFRDDEDFSIPIESPKSPAFNKSDVGPVESDPKSASLKRDKQSEEFDRLFPWEGEEKLGAKRALDFGDDDNDTGDIFNGIGDTEKGDCGNHDLDWDGFWENTGEKRKRDEGGDTESNEAKQKKGKRGDKSSRAGSNPKVPKRKKKEEKAQFANFQRELRERKDVAFKPVFVAAKPISSVLEKIRQRKLNLSKKASFSSNKEYTGPLHEIVPEDVLIHEKEDSKERRSKLKGSDAIQTAKVDYASSPSSTENTDGSPLLSCGQKTIVTSLEENEDDQQAFRAPADDTQDLFPESQTRDSQEDHSYKEIRSPCDEDLVPSLPSMNLKLDSVPADDMSDDDEDSDKENSNPSSDLSPETNSFPKGDPVKAFVDEEASEEDDSDNDKMRFGDDDDEGEGDDDEVADLIATNYSEKPIDHEMRNELHQKWLEQQDEAGIDHLLQKSNLKYGFSQGDEIASLEFDKEETNAVGEADDESGGDEESDDGEDILNANLVRFSTKQLRQMIPKMFVDKDEGGYVSSEDEETEKRLTRQHTLGKMALEEKVTAVLSAEEETSREVSGRARKLNIVQQPKKKSKITSFFEASLIKVKVSNSSTKSSFLHRASSIPVSRKKSGSSVTRGFIFGRDDSNSRSSMSVQEEDSSEVIDPAAHNTNSKAKRITLGAKYGGSQARLGSQSSSSLETNRLSSSLSLFDVLSRSSAHSRDSFAAQDETIDHQAVFAAMKATAMRSANIEATN